jgi:hypothetical protein
MKDISTGTGLCVLGLCVAFYPVVDHLLPRAEAGATHAAAAAQEVPTIVWMGVTSNQGGNQTYSRLWSDGRMEARQVFINLIDGCVLTPSCPTDWIEVPPPPSGNGFACRADLDGNRTIDGADLGIILASWGPQAPCQPEATYPCISLTNLR